MFVGLVEEIGGLPLDTGRDKVKQVSLGMERQRLHGGNFLEDEADRCMGLTRIVNMPYDK